MLLLMLQPVSVSVGLSERIYFLGEYIYPGGQVRNGLHIKNVKHEQHVSCTTSRGHRWFMKSCANSMSSQPGLLWLLGKKPLHGLMLTLGANLYSGTASAGVLCTRSLGQSSGFLELFCGEALSGGGVPNKASWAISTQPIKHGGDTIIRGISPLGKMVL